MANTPRTYRLTKAGRDAWEAQDNAVPADYRRILWLMDFYGHAGVVEDLLRHYPQNLLDEWLGELHELGLIEPVPEGEAPPLPRDSEPTLSNPDLRRDAQAAAQSAGETLARTGAYLAADRIARRDPLAKSPGDTVILIVEDDPDQLALADLRLSMAGYKVRVAASVNAFLQSMLDDGPPDLLLLDAQLPDGDGFEVLSRMRKHHSFGAMPIVMLTAQADPADIGKGLVLGADGYITKPYSKNILADVIGRVLRQN
jgi:CheY-like chemotaxis protein